MKRSRFLLLIMLITFMMVGCTNLQTESTDRISSPKNNQAPVIGTWKIVRVADESSNDKKTSVEEWENKTLEFSEDYMTLGDYYLESPRYQVKSVNGKQYLLYSHKSFLKDFNIPDAEMEVITVIDKDKYFCDIVRISDNELVLSIHNYNFYLKKISNELNKSPIYEGQQKEANSYNFISYKEDSLIRSGVLLGLRSNNSNSSSEYSYRTIWIASKNKTLNPILETEEIIFPRRSGFWKIDTKRNTEAKRTEDFLFAYNVSTDNLHEKMELKPDYSDWLMKIGQIHKRIDYIGNDYVSIEVLGNGGYENSDKNWYENSLQILPIDSLSSKKSVRITDLSGGESLASVKLGIQKTIEKLGINENNLINRGKVLDNFGLERKMGHWFFKGRINYMLENEFHFADYNINIIPPSKLVFYDELNIPWTYIKNKVPGAMDAFTSPNKDIILVLTKKEIIVYGIEKGEIENVPLKRIALKDNETVIMAEWATGDYAENWSKALASLSDD